MMNTKPFPYKKTIRAALEQMGLGFDWEYYNDVCNNSVTHRRFKFTVTDRRALSESEIEQLTELLQTSFPEYKVAVKNLYSSTLRVLRNYVIVYLRWRKD